MLATITSNSLSRIKIRNINRHKIFFPQSNHSTDKSNLISSNQRFNNDSDLTMPIKNEIMTKKIFSKKKKIENIKIKTMKNKSNKVNKVLKNKSIYNCKSTYVFPILPKIDQIYQTIIPYNEYKLKKILKHPIYSKSMANDVIKKNIRQLLINPVSLNLEKSKKEFKKKFKIKEPFLNRVQVYKKRIKEELFDNKTRNLSSINESNFSNITKIYKMDKKNNNNLRSFFSNSTIYDINKVNKDVHKDLNVLYKKLVNSKIYNQKAFFNNRLKFKIKKNRYNDEVKNNKYFCW